MPLPEKFYTIEGKEVSLDKLCAETPEWAANRIRSLTAALDSIVRIAEVNAGGGSEHGKLF